MAEEKEHKKEGKNKKEKKEKKHKRPMSKTKFLGISIIVASIILGGALIYAARTLSDVAIERPAPDIEDAKEGAKDIQPGEATLEVDEDDHVRGESNAAVTLVEFSDFQCPFCSRFHQTITQALDEYQTQVRWVYKHFPSDAIYPQARFAAESSECAAEQGKFWEYNDALFENQSQLSELYYPQLALDLGLNVDSFNECVSSRKYKDKVEKDYQLGFQLGVRGTPASFINGELLVGAIPYSSLQLVIEKALAGNR